MRRADPHALLSRLALVAALLLATLPTLGRLAMHAHRHAPGHSMAMPMAAGHTLPAAPPTGPAEPASPLHLHGLDCAYCALLAGTLPTVARSLLVLPHPPATQVAAQGAVPRAVGPTGPGLGARGPPPAA